MKIKLVIADGDEKYIRRLSSYFQIHYADKLELYLFSSEEALKDFLKENVVHVILLGEDMKDFAELPEHTACAWLVYAAGLNEFQGRRAICRFQKAERIYREILSLFSEVDGCFGFGGGEGSTRVCLFTSAQGGAGTSTAAAAWALHLAVQGKRVFYLNLESFGESGLYFEGEGNQNFSDVIFSLKSKKSSLSVKIESSIRTDRSGVQYFEAGENPFDRTELGVEEIERLLRELSAVQEYDVLIVDRELTLDPVFTELAAGMVSQIVLVDDGSETGNRKLLKALEAVKVLEKRKGVPILTKCVLLYNRFSSSHGRKLEKLPVSEAGGIPRYEGASPRALAEKLSVLPVFEKL